MTSPASEGGEAARIRARLAGLGEERAAIETRLAALEDAPSTGPEGDPTGSPVTDRSPSEAKIALFRLLFAGREDVFPRRRRGPSTTSDMEKRGASDIVRLLLLTGCRKSEILRLRWSEVHEESLVLAEAKTGPRKVPLNRQARRILQRQPRTGSPFVFPSPRDPSRPRGAELALWRRVRKEAG